MEKNEIKSLRKRLGLSQREFAKELNVTQSAVAHWEAGLREPIKESHKQLNQLEQSGTTKKTSGKVITKNIPLELKELDQWVCWKTEVRDGKPTKPPRMTTGEMADSSDPATWTSFEKAQAGYENGNAEGVRPSGRIAPRFDGIGFVFSADDDLCGIDLDKCRDAETGEIQEWADNWIQKLNSYTEVSPSGKGVHVIIKGKKKGDAARKDKIEIYDKVRYFTITGNVLNGHLVVENRQAELDELYNILFAAEKEKDISRGETQTSHVQPQVVLLDDQEIIEKAQNAKDGEKFTTLWEGDTSGYDSQSEADLALCSLLAFWTGNDHDRIDALFRQSGLYRDDKWEREDYRARTLSKATEQTNSYNPQYQQSDISNITVENHPTIPIAEEKPPKFPDSAWRGFFDEFRMAHTFTTEAPTPFLFAGMLTAVGSIIGRQCWIWYAKKLYPNFYVAIVGMTARTRKSTAAAKSNQLIRNSDPNVIHSYGLASAEGFIQLLSPLPVEKEEEIDGLIDNSELAVEDAPPKYNAWKARLAEGTSEYEGMRLFCYIDEFSGLLKKSAKEGSAGLTEAIISAYDNPPKLDNPTRTSPLSAPLPSVTLIATTTKGRLMRHLLKEEMEGGFANRFVYFCGERQEPIPRPGEPNGFLLNRTITHLAGLRRRWQNAQFSLSDESGEIWDEYYHKWFYETDNDVIDPITGRLPDNTMKLALQYAILENDEPVILPDQMSAAIDVSGYWHAIIRTLFKDYGLTEEQKIEVDILQAVSNGGKTKDELYAFFSRHIDARTLNSGLENLQKVGKVAQKREGTKGRPRNIFQLVQ